MIISILAAIVGLFFVLARFRFFWDPSKPAGFRWLNADRFASLRHKMEYCGFRKYPGAFAWFAAVTEVVGGIGMMIPYTRPYAALAIAGILVVATSCTCRDKVMEQNPVDCVDMVCAYLWRVEGLYIAITAAALWHDWGALLP